MKISGGISPGDIVCSECGKDLQEYWSLHHHDDGTSTLKIEPHYCGPKDPHDELLAQKLDDVAAALRHRTGKYTS